MPISTDGCLVVLQEMGISSEIRDIVKIARSRVGKSSYRRGADPNLWPGVLDCSALTKWSYGQLGIWLPRYSVDQRDFGLRTDNISNMAPGDLIFKSGFRNYYWDNRADGVGHVGLISSSNSVIHAANSKVGIIESYIDDFTDGNDFRGVTRIAENLGKLFTLTLPNGIYLETSMEVRWKILQTLQ